MADARSLLLFCEDVAHERFLSALVRRIATEARRHVSQQTVCGRGGRGRALSELRAFLKTMRPPDVLVVGIDANCQGWNAARGEIESAVSRDRFPRCVIACPDPHIERWYLADPASLNASLGAQVTRERAKCERDVYKRQLRSALTDAGHTVTLGGAEFADEIVAAMDLYRASKNEPSLRSFVEMLRAAMAG